MGAVEPRHFLSGGLGAMPSDANGVPFNAACIDVGGNLLANMRANVAAEAIGRTLAARLREMTDDPGMKDMLSFLIARDRCTSSSGSRLSRTRATRSTT